MAKSDDGDKTEACPAPPAGCGGKGYTEEMSGNRKIKMDCFVCSGSGRIPKMD